MKDFLRYPPALTERLTANNYETASGEIRPLTAAKMRRLIINELLELFNHANIESSLDEKRHPQLASSAINYGIPRRLAYDSEKNGQSIGQDIHTAILRFEPRIIPETLTVRVLTADEQPGKYAVITFEIAALIYWVPQPVDLVVNGRYDTGTDTFTIS